MARVRSVTPYVLSITAAAILVTAVVVLTGGLPSEDGLKAALFFAAFGTLAHALGYQVSKGTIGSIDFLPFLAAGALVPGGASLVAVMFAIAAGETLRKQEPIKFVFNVAQQTLALGLAILAYRALGGQPLIEKTSTLTVWSLLALCSIYQLTNKFAVAGVVSLSNGRPILQASLKSIRHSGLYDILAMPLVALFAFAYREAGPGWSICLAVPMLGLRQLYKTNFELEKINEELLQLMVAAIEARDPYTSGHSQRVAEYSKVVSKAAGLGSKAAARVFTAALLHDVGKIHEEFASILRKPGRLTDSEYAVMKMHSEKGAALVAKVSQLRDLVQPIRGHHEAWDGHGYPDGLVGAEIPLWSRVIAFADTIDAMTTDRPYRRALTHDAVRTEIEAQVGRQFDPDVAVTLISEKHWPLMAEAIRRGGATRRPTPMSVEAVPRHSAARRSVAAS
jgi:hypothetical protein